MILPIADSDRRKGWVSHDRFVVRRAKWVSGSDSPAQRDLRGHHWTVANRDNRAPKPQ